MVLVSAPLFPLFSSGAAPRMPPCNCQARVLSGEGPSKAKPCACNSTQALFGIHAAQAPVEALVRDCLPKLLNARGLADGIPKPEDYRRADAAKPRGPGSCKGQTPKGRAAPLSAPPLFNKNVDNSEEEVDEESISGGSAWDDCRAS